jgi:hypothetical protein
MKDGEFNKLSENIDEIGFAEPIHVALNKDGTYTIIGGEHRYRAASLRDIETLPAIVLDDLEEGKDNWENKRRFQLVRLNVIKGKIDPLTFTLMVEKLGADYSKDIMADMFGFANEKAFLTLYKEVRAALPSEMQKELDKSKAQIRTIEDLSRILNKIFTEHGQELDHGFMWFTYGGIDHFYVKMDKKLLDTMRSIDKQLHESGGNINDLLNDIIPKGYEQQKTLIGKKKVV